MKYIKGLGPDEVNSICLKLFDFLVDDLGLSLDENDDWTALQDCMSEYILIDYIDPQQDYNYN